MNPCRPATIDNNSFPEDYGLGGRASKIADVFQVRYQTEGQQKYALQQRVYRQSIDMSAIREGAARVVVLSGGSSQVKRTWPVGLAIGVAGLAEALRRSE